MIDGLKAFSPAFFADAGGICATALDVVGAGAADAFGADKISGLLASIVLSGVSTSRMTRGLPSTFRPPFVREALGLGNLNGIHFAEHIIAILRGIQHTLRSRQT